MTRRALITGITGQDGSYLAELLLSKGYDVHGMVRRSSEEKFERIAHLRDRIALHQGDLLDQFSIAAILARVEPDEIYNLAAQSFVPTSWSQPVLTGEFTALGVTKMLEAIRHTLPSTRFYQASSSEMFGKVREVPQNEQTPCEAAFARVDLDWQKYVYVDSALVRPAEVELLIGDATKARQKLGWQPKVRFQQLIEMMVDADLARLKKGSA